MFGSKISSKINSCGNFEGFSEFNNKCLDDLTLTAGFLEYNNSSSLSGLKWQKTLIKEDGCFDK